MRYKIILGDPSGDGHGWTEVFEVEVFSNETPVTADVLLSNYKKNVGIVGFDPKDICSDYEDSKWPDEVIEKLRAVGWKFPEGFDDNPYPDDLLGRESYVGLLMFFATWGLGVHWEMVENDSEVLFGENGHYGYGYFYS